MLDIAISSHALTAISFDRSSPTPVYVQLCEQIRGLIQSGRLVSDVRMPSSRTLSQELGVSRKTVVNAYDQLTSEGYLKCRLGAGTFVEDVTEIQPAKLQSKQLEPASSGAVSTKSYAEMPLASSMPDITKFPRSAWSRAASRAQRVLDLDSMFSVKTCGYQPLREAIADHLRAMRGLDCNADQIIITTGLVESIGLISNGLLNPQDKVAIEDPGLKRLKRSLHNNQIRPIATPVDDQGMNIDQVIADDLECRAIIVTPSRQYPLGVQLGLKRRTALVDWANTTGGWVVEDDFDCEYRFTGRPLQAMYAMDRANRTLYLGSLSKVLFPRLGISFIVGPRGAIEAMAAYQSKIGPQASMLTQAALCEFMHSGQFSTHLRQMRRLYKSRYEYIFANVEQKLGDILSPLAIGGGTQFVAFLKPSVCSTILDTTIEREAFTAGIGVYALSPLYSSNQYRRQGLIIGFASTDRSKADEAISGLRKIFDRFI